MTEYRIINGFVLHTPTGRFIPDDPANADWNVYQAWLAAGNTPAPAQSAENINEVRRLKIQGVRQESLRRMQALYPAIKDLDEVRLYRDMLLSIAPAALNPRPNIQTLQAIHQAGRDAIQGLQAETSAAAILAYDPVTGPAWPP